MYEIFNNLKSALYTGGTKLLDLASPYLPVDTLKSKAVSAAGYIPLPYTDYDNLADYLWPKPEPTQLQIALQWLDDHSYVVSAPLALMWAYNGLQFERARSFYLENAANETDDAKKQEALASAQACRRYSIGFGAGAVALPFAPWGLKASAKFMKDSPNMRFWFAKGLQSSIFGWIAWNQYKKGNVDGAFTSLFKVVGSTVSGLAKGQFIPEYGFMNALFITQPISEMVQHTGHALRACWKQNYATAVMEIAQIPVNVLHVAANTAVLGNKAASNLFADESPMLDSAVDLAAFFAVHLAMKQTKQTVKRGVGYFLPQYKNQTQAVPAIGADAPIAEIDDSRPGASKKK